MVVGARPRRTSFLRLVPRKETWLVLGVPETSAADKGKRGQAFFTLATVFVQK